ncbi:MAG: N-acyl amino acid synthase FeeM domain-containing protein [Thermodesulfobacteriota bacterium]
MKSMNLPAHKVYKPSSVKDDQRCLCRIPVRDNEGITAAARIPSLKDPLLFNVADISSMGVCVESEDPVTHGVQPGDILDLSLACRDEHFRFECLVRHLAPLENNRIRLGLSRRNASAARPAPDSPFDRISLIASCRHPYYYNENVVLRITSLSRKDCMVECEDPEFLLFPAMPITLSLHLLPPDEGDITGRVTWMEIPEKGKTRFGVAIRQLPQRIQGIIAGHLFHLHDWKPRELRELGLNFKGYRPLIKFRSMRTHDEYLEVLRLRRIAYTSVGKIQPTATDADLASDLDRKSRILTAYHHNTMVGTVSLLFPDHEKMTLDTEKTFMGGFPKPLPSKKSLIEIARLCITPDYRATDILFGLFEQIYMILITSGREYLLSSTDDHMWTLYKRMGFKKTGMSYEHPLLNGLPHHVMILHKNSLLFGMGISPFVWLKFFRNMTDHLRSMGAIRLNTYQKSRILLNKILDSAIRGHSVLK